MRDAPTFAEPVQEGLSGDDPLGLAATSEHLYNSAFPGFNNVVRYIRVYSAICWMCEQVADSLNKRPVATNRDARLLFEGAIEKIELALTWANPGATGLAGGQRVFPSDNRPVEMRFSAFGSNQATNFNAQTYQPSLTRGLRFLEARELETFRCLPNGVALASAFDQAASSLPGYRWLKAPDRLDARLDRIQALAPVLDLAHPSLEEQAAFLASFFPAELAADSSNNDRARWLTLKLMLRATDATCRANRVAGLATTASPDEIRACMARGMAADGTSVVSSEVGTVQAWWAVLQVRQMQRLCLETLYCVLERWIAERESGGGSQALEDCLDELSQSGLAYVHEDFRETVGQMESFFADTQAGCASLYEAATRWRAADQGDENDADVFLHVRRLNDRRALDFDDDGDCDAIANAYIGLVFCAVETRNLSAHADALSAMKADADSCSMLRLAELVRRFHPESIQAFLKHVIKEWIVLRHFEVVGSRSARFDGKNRFRFIVGDYGLERFLKAGNLPVPGVSEDKLNHALMLCEQSGLLKEANGAYSLTAAGRRRLL